VHGNLFLGFALIIAVGGFTASGETMVSCSAGGQSVTAVSSCSLTGPSGSYSNVTTAESDSLNAGVFDYVATANLRAFPDIAEPSSSQPAATFNVGNSFDLMTTGPVRAGYIDYLSSSILVQAVDAGTTASEVASLQAPGGYSTSCYGSTGGQQCLFPFLLIPITLGEPIALNFASSGSGLSNPIFGYADITLNANVQIEIFEADGVTEVPVTSVVTVTPEPVAASFLLLGAIPVCFALFKRART
jgi:hypothetical protein